MNLPARELSSEGQEKKELDDFRFTSFSNDRDVRSTKGGKARGLKELTILKGTQEIRHGDEITLPAGSERVATFYRHFAE